MKYKKELTINHFLILIECKKGFNNINEISKECKIHHFTVSRILNDFLKVGIIDYKYNVINVPKIEELDIRV